MAAAHEAETSAAQAQRKAEMSAVISQRQSCPQQSFLRLGRG